MERTIIEKKDYTEKIKNKLPVGLLSEDINNIIIWFNFCFSAKNNFFVENFNKRSIKNIYVFYNQLKTNILNSDINDLLFNTDSNNKLIRFILINFVNNYDNISTIENNVEICGIVSEESVKRFIHFLHKK